MRTNLKAFRESLSMSQKDFADSLGIAKTTYHGYETGIREPRSDFWVAVAEKYGVTIDYLMGYSNDPNLTSTDAKKVRPLSVEAIKLARAYDALDEYGKKLIDLVMTQESSRCIAEESYESQLEETPGLKEYLAEHPGYDD
ncbi:MAG: helix-turn-helix transcriptional regulator [Dysosmobacter sp.]|nr:helix-turn-helix transcriptional regulator [Dysosmobacter sp.]